MGLDHRRTMSYASATELITRKMGPLIRARSDQPRLSASPRAAKTPHHSSTEPSPLTPPGNPPGSVICNWQRGDILIGRLQSKVAEWLMENHAMKKKGRSGRSTKSRKKIKHHI